MSTAAQPALPAGWARGYVTWRLHYFAADQSRAVCGFVQRTGWRGPVPELYPTYAAIPDYYKAGKPWAKNLICPECQRLGQPRRL